jgi:hypothetical protein
MINERHDEGSLQRGAGVADFISQTMRNRPEALLLMAAGAALMLARGRGLHLHEGASGGVAAGIGERLHSAADTAAQMASDLRQRVGEQVEDLRESVGDYAERATHRAEEGREALTHRTGEAFEQARRGLRENVDYMLREQPLALGALSLLAGVAIGAALPRTVIETRTVRVAREPLRGAQGRRETLRSAVGDVGEKVKEAIAGGVAEADKLREAAMRATTKAS